jgi:hypothetical protein
MGLDNLDQNYYDRNFPGTNHPWNTEETAIPTDALGNPIVIGNTYGYSQQQNGSVTIVIGTAEKAKDLKVTIGNAKSRSGVWGSISNDFTSETRKRSVNACHLFPIYE